MGGKCMSTCWIFISVSNRTLNNCNKVSKNFFPHRTVKNIYRSVKFPLLFILKEEMSKKMTLKDMLKKHISQCCFSSSFPCFWWGRGSWQDCLCWGCKSCTGLQLPQMCDMTWATPRRLLLRVLSKKVLSHLSALVKRKCLCRKMDFYQKVFNDHKVKFSNSQS